MHKKFYDELIRNNIAPKRYGSSIYRNTKGDGNSLVAVYGCGSEGVVLKALRLRVVVRKVVALNILSLKAVGLRGVVLKALRLQVVVRKVVALSNGC